MAYFMSYYAFNLIVMFIVLPSDYYIVFLEIVVACFILPEVNLSIEVNGRSKDQVFSFHKRHFP